MTRDIGQRLLDHTEDDELAVLCQPADILIDLQVDLDAAALLEAFEEIAQSEIETRLVEIGRMKKIGDGAKLAVRLFEILLELVQKRHGLGGEAVSEASGEQAGGDEVLTGRVMQIAGDASARLVLGANQGGGKRPRGLAGVAQLLHHRTQQEDRYREASEEKLKGKGAHLLVLAGEQAAAAQGGPRHDGGDDQNGAACALFAITDR